MKLLIDNLKWIILFVVILLLTNYLTCTNYKTLSRKEKKVFKSTLDSLHNAYLLENVIQNRNLARRKFLHAEDSLLLVQYQAKVNKDRVLIKEQQAAINKFKKIKGTVLIQKLDSGFRAENTIDLLTVDSIFQLSKSRISYCVGKLEEVKILKERIVIKDSVTAINLERLVNKTAEINTFTADVTSLKNQLKIKTSADSVNTILTTDVTNKNKSLKRQNTGLKAGIVILVAGIVYSWTN